MDAVIKIGGSLQSDPHVLKRTCRSIEKISRRHHLLIVPGGGKFVDLVRELQLKYGLSDQTAHLMSILGMNFYGLTLHELIWGSNLVEDLKEVGSKGCSIFLPYETLKSCEELEPSWEVTSDAIAGWASAKIGCKKLILVKMVDGIFGLGKIQRFISIQKLKKIDQSTVDRKLLHILEDTGMKCWIVNGRYPTRVEKILAGKKTIGTEVSP